MPAQGRDLLYLEKEEERVESDRSSASLRLALKLRVAPKNRRQMLLMRLQNQSK